VQRLVSLAVMAALLSGGWKFLSGGKPGVDRQAVSLNRGGYAQNQPASPNAYPPGPPQQPQQSYQANRRGPIARPVSQPYPQSPTIRSAPTAPAFPPVGATQRTDSRIRIASFNIQVFGQSKAGKPYVMETLGAIVRNFDIVAIQEIRTKDEYHLQRFLEYVNQGGRRKYDFVIGPRLGRSRSKEQYAFLFNTATVEVNRSSVYTVSDPDDMLHREPLVAMFRTRGIPPQEAFTFVLVNIHTDPDETRQELDALAQVYHVVRQSAGGEDDILVLGDLNVNDTNLGQLGQIPAVRPIVTGVFTNTRQNRLYDNILLHTPSTAEFTGRWGVYDIGQLHGLSRDQVEQVSDHLPVWAEFSAYESMTPGRVATRPQ